MLSSNLIRDEIGISESASAQPIQAALPSAGAFTVGAGVPSLIAWIAPESQIISLVAVLSLLFLALLGDIDAGTGGAGILVDAPRVTF